MADSAILREYLVALGFQIDKTGEKKANQALTGLDKQAISLGKNVTKVGLAVTGMVTVFAAQMEKLYYSSIKTDSTVGSLQALEYGARQVGISSDQMRGSLEGFARTMRLNPGMIAFLSGKMGISTQGKETAQVYSEFIDKLGEMPFFLAAKFGAMFGQDPDSLYLMIKQRKEMKAAEQERREMAAAVGLDTEKAKNDAHDYMVEIRRLTEHINLLSASLLSTLLPSFKELSAWMNQHLDDLTRDINKSTQEGGEGLGSMLWRRFKTGLGRMTPGYSWLTEMRDAEKGKKPAFHWFGTDPVGQQAGVNLRTGQPYAGPTKANALFADLEKKYALPAGWLDRLWETESARGTNMVSKAGALGHFQFMPKTAKEFGLKDPFNLAEAAEAAARKSAGLISEYGGDLAMAAAGYNAGQGNLSAYGVTNSSQLGRARPETQEFVKKMVPNLSTSYTINLGPNGYSAGDQQRLEQTMRDNNADMVRQFLVRNR